MSIKKIAVVTLVFGGLLAGSYIAFKKSLRDRQAMANFSGFADQQRGVHTETTKDGRTVRTYTAKELAEARKNGKLPPGSSPSDAAVANEVAVQRSLRTIQEINRINEMNQRLQEQQQRMQNQKK